MEKSSQIGLLVLVLIPTLALADTQTKFVGTGALGASGTVTWNNIGNITADDASMASTSNKFKNGGDAATVLATMSGNVFTIPAGATINGITVTVESDDNNSGPADDENILIIKGGSTTGTDQDKGVDNWPQSLNTQSWGGTSELWGTTWTVSEINATNFGVSIRIEQVENAFTQPTIDYVQISIDYTPGGGGGTNAQIMGMQIYD